MATKKPAKAPPRTKKPARAKKLTPARPRKSTPARPKTPARLSLPREQLPPDEVTRDRFLVWRMPRVGVGNPHRMNSPSWQWLARHRDLNAYMANNHFAGPSSFEVGPCWCAHRFGQTDTTLPDGRTIAIGGEHEDHYDPDFWIYNDVLVTSPDGTIAIYGYPLAVFPPTDFHTATLVGDRIVIIGSLGHPSQRRPGHTPVLALATDTLAITPLATAGDPPGWLHEHTAELSADQRSITVRGGKRLVLDGDEQTLRDSIDDWSLDLATLTWTRLTERPWSQWELSRDDGQSNHLFEIKMMSWYLGGTTPFHRKQLAESAKNLGFSPDFALHAARYAPPFEHEVLPEVDGQHDRHAITVDGIAVRYDEDLRGVSVTIEGVLDAAKVAALLEDARQKLSALEHHPFVARRL